MNRPTINFSTQEQLGYFVSSQLKTSGDHTKALILLVQGEAKDPVHMATRMHNFWQTVRKQLVAPPPLVSDTISDEEEDSDGEE